MFQYADVLILIGIISLIYYPFGMKYINNKLSIEQKSFLFNCSSPLFLVLAVIISLLSWPAYYSLVPTASHPIAIIFSAFIILIAARRINMYIKLKKNGFAQNYLHVYAINTLVLLIGLAFIGVALSVTPPYYHKHTTSINS